MHWAVVTGATAGIGSAFSRRLATEGYALLITGRRAERLDELATELHDLGAAAVETLPCDLSLPEDRSRLVERLRSGPATSVLINNAGFGLPGRFMEEDVSGHLRMIEVHVAATTQLTHAVLPKMVHAKGGAIINVASVAAHIALPRSSTYCATKAFVVRFSEALAIELASSGIVVQALCPGFTRTEFHERMGDERIHMKSRGLMRWMKADDVVASSLKRLGSSRVVHVPGFSNRLMLFLVGLIPKTWFSKAARRFA